MPSFRTVLAHAKSAHVGSDDERRGPLDVLAVPLGRRLRERRDDAGAMPVPDPLLMPVEDPVRAVVAQPRRSS